VVCALAIALCATPAFARDGRLKLPVPVPGLTPSGPQPQPYGTNDAGGFRNVLPPGSNGFDNAAELAAFEATGQRPAHNDDQLPLYRDLLYAVPGLTDAQLPKYFKDATFGVKPEDVASVESPRSDVTIIRDKQYGVPHIYGSTRGGTMFGEGYATAEDRLFFIDVLRHLGRAQLSSFAGGAEANREFDRGQWAAAPYTEADLTKQVNQFTQLYGQEGDQVRQDVTNYVLGINQYIAEAKLNPLQMPGEYAAIGKPLGPTDFTGEDLISIASLVGAIFGNGGGDELASAQVLQAAKNRFGAKHGKAVWADFREAEDPEAPTTVHNGDTFPYEVPPKKPARGSLALPDPGSFKDLQGKTIAHSSSTAKARGLLAFPGAMSNALVVSAAHSQSGHPLAVFGPQTGYFAPEILMEQDVHGPGIDARGVSFPGTNVYVELGRGRDYSWSATSAGSDISDTWALPLCDPNGGRPTVDSLYYLYKGQCQKVEQLSRTNSWTPNAADQTPPGSETLTAQRTPLGVVTGRATVHGKPVLYVTNRTTYFHEVDSALGFRDMNDPNTIQGPRDFQKAMSKVGYAFNWFYVDDKHTAYFNSGADPVRNPSVDPNFPAWGRSQFLWKNFNDQLKTEATIPFSQHPQAIDQDYFTSWNNKQAPGFRAADQQWGYGPIYRSQLLDEKLQPEISGNKKTTLAGVANAMEGAGTVDMRADFVLPLALKLLGNQSDPAVAKAIDELKAWRADGAHRIDRNRDGVYEHSDAIRIMDAWWPLWMHAEFEPALGSDLFGKIQDILSLDNPPNNGGEHLGSAYQDGWWGYASKDLRRIMGMPEKGKFSRVYCGRGSETRCRAALLRSLKAAIATPGSKIYQDEVCSKQGKQGDQACYDTIMFRALGAITQPLTPWVNRPTFQQAVEIPKHLTR
jgi:acyl-homoserine lactone acylase PvdQ